jgi:hypothetical protein
VNYTGPLVFLKERRAADDIYEIQIVGEGCRSPGLLEHDPAGVTSVNTAEGRLYICKRCASVWLDSAQREPDPATVAAQESVDQRDAARYRYLRSNPHFSSEYGRLEWYLPARNYVTHKTRVELLDETIDDQIKRGNR